MIKKNHWGRSLFLATKYFYYLEKIFMEGIWLGIRTKKSKLELFGVTAQKQLFQGISYLLLAG